MEDKVITVVFGSLGATLALVSILFAYLQLRGFRPAIAPDEEQVMPLAVVAHEELVTSPPTVVVQEESVTCPSAVVVQDEPVVNSPCVTCLATLLYKSS